MQAIIIADLHLSLYANDKIVQGTGLPERLYFINQSLYKVAEYAKEKEVENIIIAGDIFHTKSIIHSLAQSVFLDFVRKYKDLTFLIIDGNHDLSERTNFAVSSLKCVDNEPNVVMIHKKEKIDNILFVPWSQTMVEDIKSGNADYLVAHFGLNEGNLSSGISIISDLRLSDLNQYKKCFLGHYHLPQEVGNVIYIGSLIHLDWNDKNQEKRFLLVDTERDEIQSIKSEGYRKFYEFTVTEENKDEIAKKSKELTDNGNEVHIVKNQEVNLSSLFENVVVIDKTKKDITNRGITSSMTTEEKLKRFYEIKEIPQQNQEEFLQIASDIIETALGGSN